MTDEAKQCWLIAILALLLMLAVASVASAPAESGALEARETGAQRVVGLIRSR